ncbi:hypothetical protein LMH73_007500 [Vibrio splendidus]|nr:hypothetical protein [Vibrio splendidus]MCC4880374.1 hypothetical protein [Vibrio splendidus]
MLQELNRWDFAHKLRNESDILNSAEHFSSHSDCLEFSEQNFIKLFGRVTNNAPSCEQSFKDICSFLVVKNAEQPMYLIENDNKVVCVSYSGYCVISDENESIQLPPEKAIHLLSRLFGSLNKELIDSDPALSLERSRNEFIRHEIEQRQLRIKNVPLMPEDFWSAVRELANYATCYDEFKQLLSPAMDDISDRNYTRIGRAAERLYPDIDTLSDGKVRVYRCLPSGCDIEAGDWVSLDRDYAKLHESNVQGKASTISRYVNGTDVICGADGNEYIYVPENTWGSSTSIESLWETLTKNRKPHSYPDVNMLADKAMAKIHKKNSSELLL